MKKLLIIVSLSSFIFAGEMGLSAYGGLGLANISYEADAPDGVTHGMNKASVDVGCGCLFNALCTSGHIKGEQDGLQHVKCNSEVLSVGLRDEFLKATEDACLELETMWCIAQLRDADASNRKNDYLGRGECIVIVG